MFIFRVVDLTVECFDKTRKGQPLMPLQSLKSFTLLHNGDKGGATGWSSSTNTSPTHRPSPGRRARSISPMKEVKEILRENPSENPRKTLVSTNQDAGLSNGSKTKLANSPYLKPLRPLPRSTTVLPPTTGGPSAPPSGQPVPLKMTHADKSRKKRIDEDRGN